MSDSEEESLDRQLKIVVLGDGTSGKVSPLVRPPCQACKESRRGPGALRTSSSSPSPRASPYFRECLGVWAQARQEVAWGPTQIRRLKSDESCPAPFKKKKKKSFPNPCLDRELLLLFKT